MGIFYEVLDHLEYPLEAFVEWRNGQIVPYTGQQVPGGYTMYVRLTEPNGEEIIAYTTDLRYLTNPSMVISNPGNVEIFIGPTGLTLIR